MRQVAAAAVAGCAQGVEAPAASAGAGAGAGCVLVI